MRRFRFALIPLLIYHSVAWAAITEANLTSGENNADHTSATTASITPSADRLVVACVVQRRGADGTAAPTLSGNSLTYVQIATIEFQARRRITCFRAMGASPTTGAITIDYSAATQKSSHWSVFEFDGVDTTGTNGSGAVVQSATNSGTATSSNVTLAAFGDATNNAAVGATGIDDVLAVTPETGYAEIHDVGAAGLQTIETEWNTGEDLSVTASWTGTQIWGMIGIEVKVAPAAAARRVFLVN